MKYGILGFLWGAIDLSCYWAAYITKHDGFMIPGVLLSLGAVAAIISWCFPE